MFFLCFNIKSCVLVIIILFKEWCLFKLHNRTTSYVTVNNVCVHYEDQCVKMFRKIVSFYCDNYIKRCVGRMQFPYVAVGGMDSYQWAFGRLNICNYTFNIRLCWLTGICSYRQQGQGLVLYCKQHQH